MFLYRTEKIGFCSIPSLLHLPASSQKQREGPQRYCIGSGRRKGELLEINTHIHFYGNRSVLPFNVMVPNFLKASLAF